MNKSKTFREIYESIDTSAVSPKTQFIMRIAKATMRSENAVRMWINGRQIPDMLVQNVIAKELGVPVEGLFPNKNCTE